MVSGMFTNPTLKCKLPVWLRILLICEIFRFSLASADENFTPPSTSTGITDRGVTDHTTANEKPAYRVENDCLEELFRKYGRDGKLTFEGFEKLLFNIGLGKSKEVEEGEEHDDSSGEEHHDMDLDNHREKLNDDVPTKGLIMIETGQKKSDDKYHDVFGDFHSDVHADKHTDQDHISLCMSPGQLIHVYGFHPWQSLDKSDFSQICPILVQQLDTHSCIQETGLQGEEQHNMEDRDMFAIEGHVWGYGFLAITVISGVSLMGILTVPFTKRYPTLYRRLLSYLVALAIGTLSGDAVLHLIPHSFTGEHEDHDSAKNETHHLAIVLKGCTVLLGIYFFFIMERLMKVLTHRKKKRHEKHRHKHKERTLLHEEDRKFIGAKLQGHHERQNMSCESLHLVAVQTRSGSVSCIKESDSTNSMNHLHENNGHHHHHHHYHHGDDHPHYDTNESHPHDDEDPGKFQHDDEETAVHHHGHSHHHGNLKDQSIASIAWMVIMGDGLHNFSDGMAIGAAFASSLTGGLSTTIAVFCHELPHELGDFAILLTTGMTVKQAIMYSLLSSVLAYIGVFIGLALGNINTFSLWIFALAGGMFLYIALVDMMPQMTNASSGENESQCWHLLLQNLGMLTGIGIMILIAIFEDRLRKALQ